MLDVLGKGYVIDHCISLFKNKNEEKAYKIYVTDALYALANGYYQHNGAKNMPMPKRFYDMMYLKKDKPNKKEETSEEIIARIKNKLGAKS